MENEQHCEGPQTPEGGKVATHEVRSTRLRLSAIMGLSSKPAASKAAKQGEDETTGEKWDILSTHRSSPRRAGAPFLLSTLQPLQPVAVVRRVSALPLSPQHPPTPTPVGPLTPSSLSVTSSHEEVCASESQEIFSPQDEDDVVFDAIRVEMHSWRVEAKFEVEKEAEDKKDERVKDKTEKISAATIADNDAALESSPAELLALDVFELGCKMTKRLAFDSWNGQAAKGTHSTLVFQFRERNLVLRHTKFVVFSTWIRHISSGRKEVNLCAVRDKLLSNAIRLLVSTVKRMAKRNILEIWSRHTSVMIWTHGRLRLAAHKSRAISLRGTWARLQKNGARSRAQGVAIKHAVKRGERTLVRRIWTALLGHLISIQLQESQQESNSVSSTIVASFPSVFLQSRMQDDCESIKSVSQYTAGERPFRPGEPLSPTRATGKDDKPTDSKSVPDNASLYLRNPLAGVAVS